MKIKTEQKEASELSIKELNTLHNLYLKTAYPGKEQEPYKTLVDFEKGLEGETLYVTYESDTSSIITGFIAYYPKRGFIHLIAVDKDHQMNGIGKHLIQLVETHCLEAGYVREIRLSPDAKNKSAQKFYEQIGFIKGETYDGEQYDKAIRYHKPLPVDPDKRLNIDAVEASYKTLGKGMDKLREQGLDPKTSFFKIIQRYAEDFIIETGVDLIDDERTINTVVSDTIQIIDNSDRDRPEEAVNGLTDLDITDKEDIDEVVEATIIVAFANGEYVRVSAISQDDSYKVENKIGENLIILEDVDRKLDHY